MTVAQKHVPRVVQGPGTPMLILLALIAAAVIGGGIALWQANQPEAVPAAGVAEPVAPASAVAPESAEEWYLTEDEKLLVRLATNGYIPMQAVDWDTITTKRLVAQGVIPQQTLWVDAPKPPLFSETELLEMDLARKGLIPYEAVDWDLMYTKYLAQTGVIPYEAGLTP